MDNDIDIHYKISERGTINNAAWADWTAAEQINNALKAEIGFKAI